jgi:hypothetical protein
VTVQPTVLSFCPDSAQARIEPGHAELGSDPNSEPRAYWSSITTRQKSVFYNQIPLTLAIFIKKQQHLHL